jgi:hypothetical protein
MGSKISQQCAALSFRTKERGLNFHGPGKLRYHDKVNRTTGGGLVLLMYLMIACLRH